MRGRPPSTDGVTAMILAAGHGTRLRPLTDRVPKPLVEVAGRPLIEYALDTVVRAGIRYVVVNLHHLGERIRAHLGDGSRFGCEIRYSDETPLLDTGGGIVHARHLLGDGDVVTLNADSLVDVDLREVLSFHSARGATATMVLREDPEAESFGVIETDAGDRIVRFLSHRAPGAAPPVNRLMYSGVQVLAPRAFDYMDAGGAFSITRLTYPRMLEAEEPLYGYRMSGRWITVGTPDELAAAQRLLAATPRGS